MLARVVELAAGGDAPDVRKAALDQLLYAHRGYNANQHQHTLALDAFWESTLARIEELKAKFK